MRQARAYCGLPLLVMLAVAGVVVQGAENVATKRPDAHLREEIWRSRLAAPRDRAADAHTDLQSLIERLRAARVVRRPQTEASTGVPAEPNAPVTASPTPAHTAPPVVAVPHLTEGEPRTATLSEATLARIAALVPDDLRAEQALALGDLLYRSGYTAEATPLYRRATAAADPNAALGRADLTWALFQLGNCLRPTDPAEAKGVYQRLITDYPQSSWTRLATVRRDLADWLWREQPTQTLAESLGTDPNGVPMTTAQQGASG